MFVANGFLVLLYSGWNTRENQKEIKQMYKRTIHNTPSSGLSLSLPSPSLALSLGVCLVVEHYREANNGNSTCGLSFGVVEWIL